MVASGVLRWLSNHIVSGIIGDDDGVTDRHTLGLDSDIGATRWDMGRLGYFLFGTGLFSCQEVSDQNRLFCFRFV